MRGGKGDAPLGRKEERSEAKKKKSGTESPAALNLAQAPFCFPSLPLSPPSSSKLPPGTAFRSLYLSIYLSVYLSLCLSLRLSPQFLQIY